MASRLHRVTPPCELLVDPKPQWQQTYVVLGDHKAAPAFVDFASAQAVNGAGMWATHSTRNETYLVITLGKAGCEESNIRQIKEGVLVKPGLIFLPLFSLLGFFFLFLQSSFAVTLFGPALSLLSK